MRLGAATYCPDLFCFGVVNAAVCDVEAHITIDSHVASQLHLVRGGIVLCVIGVDVCITNVNRDIIVRRCQPIFIRRLPSGSDFNRRILRSLDFSEDQTGSRKKSGEQQNQRSHGGRRKYCIKAPVKSQNRHVRRENLPSRRVPVALESKLVGRSVLIPVPINGSLHTR